MKMIFGNPPSFGKVLRAVFTVLLKELDLEDAKMDVVVAFEPLMPSELGAQTEGKYEGDPLDSVTIALNPNIAGESIIRALCHEMVHVKQIYRDGLRRIGKVGDGQERKHPTMFKGKRYSRKDAWSESDEPWELEAYSLEGPLWEKCMARLETLGFAEKRKGLLHA